MIIKVAIANANSEHVESQAAANVDRNVPERNLKIMHDIVMMELRQLVDLKTYFVELLHVFLKHLTPMTESRGV